MKRTIEATLYWGDTTLWTRYFAEGEPIDVEGLCGLVATGEGEGGATADPYRGSAFRLENGLHLVTRVLEGDDALPAPRRFGGGDRVGVFVAGAAIVHALLLGASAHGSPPDVDMGPGRDELEQMHVVLYGDSPEPPPPPPNTCDVPCGVMPPKSCLDSYRGYVDRYEGYDDWGLIALPFPVPCPPAEDPTLASPCVNIWGEDLGDTFGGYSLSSLGLSGTPCHPLEIGLIAEGFHRTSRGDERLTIGKVDVEGRLPVDVVERIVRMNFGRFRICYENALRTTPSLAGIVRTKFVIDRTGAVMAATDAGSTLPDAGVVSCVVRSVNSLSFPVPEGGNVTVKFPISFRPGG